MTEKIRYFAYGSNLYTPRLRFRVSDCRALQVAKLVEHELRFHKKSKDDGSAKCDARLTGRAGDVVYGVVYEIPPAKKANLDRFEGRGRGYDEWKIAVVANDGTPIEAITYIASDSAVDASLKPYSWYRDFVELGAREHDLPQDYIKRFILDVPADIDPDRDREAKKRAEVMP